MNKKRFLDLVLGHEGYYCIWANRAAPDREDAEIKQKFYQTVDELIDAAQDLDADGWNTPSSRLLPTRKQVVVRRIMQSG
jgi:hypothetical protein